MRLPVALLFVVVQFAACTTAPDSAWQGTIEERDGVTWVSNPVEGFWAGKEATGFRLELEQVFGAEEEPINALLSYVSGAAVDASGNLYVVDGGSDSLVAFAPDGRVLWRVGGSGEGPGEMMDAGPIVWAGADQLYMENQNETRLDVWDLDGSFVESHSLALAGINQGYLVGLVDPGTLVFWRFNRSEQGSRVAVLADGERWEKLAEFVAGTEPKLGDDERYRTDVSIRTGGGRIWAGNRVAYRLEEFDASGVLQRVITREHPDLVPAIYLRGTGFHFGEFEAPLSLPDGYLLVPYSWVTNFDSVEEFRSLIEGPRPDGAGPLVEFDSAFDLFDAEGRYLATWDSAGLFEETGWAATVDVAGRVYTHMTEPFPQVRRYRVEIRAPR